MKYFLSFLAGISLLLTRVSAQSNVWYHSGEYDIQVAPVLWMSPESKPTYGVSVQGTMWETAYMGTAIEIGNNDAAHTYPGINFITTKQIFRVTFGRISLMSETGAEKWLYDGSTGALVGVGAEAALYKFRSGAFLGLTAFYDAHFGTTLRDSGQSAKAALSLSF